MKALVCITRSPDTTAKIVFSADKKHFDENQVQWIVNPYDEWYAIGKAIDLKQEGKLTQVDLITVGLATAEPILRKAMALGGDNIFRIDHEPTESATTAKLLSLFLREHSYDIILGGKETIDYNASAVMSMLAALLNVPFLSQINELDIHNGSCLFTHSLQGIVKKGKVNGVVVMSCQKGLSSPRLPNMKGIIAARTKKIEIKTYPIPPTTNHIIAMETQQKTKNIEWIDASNPKTLFNLLKINHNMDLI